jgi:hypothetical protein
VTDDEIKTTLDDITGPVVPWPEGYKPGPDWPDLQSTLGGLLIDWLNHADDQGPGQKWHDWQTGPKPKDGCWRDAGWWSAVKVVHKAFGRDRWVSLSRPGEAIPLTTHRWDAFPDEFLEGIQHELIEERVRWLMRDGSNFYGATGALDCCLAAIRNVRQEFTCQHQWGAVRSRSYCRDEPPEPDYKKCARCGVEYDVCPADETDGSGA